MNSSNIKLYVIVHFEQLMRKYLKNNEELINKYDYQSPLKEITKASMLDAVDRVAYQQGLGYDGVTQTTDPESIHCDAGVPGTVRIIKERFVELFIAKFAEEADLNREYKIIFNDIDECPPKVTVTIQSKQSFSFIQKAFGLNKTEKETADIVNTLSGVLETDEPFVK